jgi:hypothetical protein
MTNTIVSPTEQAVQAYETAVGALRLVDAINGGSDGNGTAVNADAHAAASTALRASLAAFLVLTCPGGEQAYYAAGATEIYEDMFTQGRGVAEALGAFLSLGWQHTNGARPGHEPYTESGSATGGSATGGSYLARGACSCGYSGPDRLAPSRSDRKSHEALTRAQGDALGHAQWPIIEPVMPVPMG